MRVTALYPEMAGTDAFIVAFSLAYGCYSGYFSSRAANLVCAAKAAEKGRSPQTAPERQHHPHRQTMRRARVRLNTAAVALGGGGTKRGQQRDIDKAKDLMAEYKARKKAMASKAGNKHKG